MINTAQPSTLSQAESLIQDFEAQTQMSSVKDFARRTQGLEEAQCSVIFIGEKNHVYLMQDRSLLLESLEEGSVHAIDTEELKGMVRQERDVPEGSIPDIINAKAIDEALERAHSSNDASMAPLLDDKNDFNMSKALVENPMEIMAHAA
jgi:hypothetical protein